MNPNNTARVGVTRELLIALRLSLLLFLLCGLIYPAITTFIAHRLFPAQAGGSLIYENGKAVGSVLIGQPFVSARYFQGRPSAAGYDPRATAGSNLAPSNPALRLRVAVDSARIQKRDGVSATAIPVDLLAASGSGLDPDISPAAALLQVPRVAQARGLSVASVRALVQAHTEGPQWKLWGQSRVNVLVLNLALDQLQRSVSAKGTSSHARQP